MARKAISKRIRFEVFKRDGFACQYCGRKAPEVVLHIDHVSPVCKGGPNELLNYVTACIDCNLGKGPREISDESILAKQQAQLEELNEKREQLRMMIKWRDGLKELENAKLEEIERAYHAAVPGWKLNDTGRRTVAGWLRDFPMDIILDSIEVAKGKLRVGQDGKLEAHSVHDYFAYIPRVAKCKLEERKDPGIGELYRLRGYLRKFLSFRDWQCMKLLREGRDAGLSSDDMKRASSGIHNWYDYEDTVRRMAGI